MEPRRRQDIVHIDALPAEVDAHYIVAVGVLGDIGESLRGIALERQAAEARRRSSRCASAIIEDRAGYADDQGFPVKPQKIVWDLREALAPDDIAISDVGAHKMWMARMYRAERPNTCIISNGFSSMGIAVPGAVAAKLAYPERKVVAVTGDAGFMMNSQEIETALRMKHAVRDPDLERLGVRAHHLAPAPALRAAEPYRVQQPRLREVRRELRG